MEYRIEYNCNTDTFNAIFEDGAVWPCRQRIEAEETALAYIATIEMQAQPQQQQMQKAAHTCDLDWTLMHVVIEDAKAKVKNDKRWINAINRAERELLHNPHMHYDGILTIESSSGVRYTVDKDHGNECIAAGKGYACWHWAARGLMKRYTEARDVPQEDIDRLNAIAEMMECFE